jgi:ASPM-SPD-2-Hydin domain-containing protein/centrosomal CEP192-like protein
MTLAGKAKCTFSVTFTPEQNATAITGVASVAYSGSFSPQNVSLTGGGTGGATPSPLTFKPATLSFKNSLVGASASLSVTVKNSSASSLSISGITASGNYTAAGSGAAPCGGPLGAGASCTMTVTFNPSINGTIKGSVAIANSTAVNPQIYNVSGAAVLPLSFSPASLTFAAQPLGSTSTAKTVTLTNNASTTMSIGFVASGDYAAFPTGATPCGASLGAHAKCTIGVTFTPSATGAIKGVVTVTYSGVAPSFSPQEMSLTGAGQ